MMKSGNFMMDSLGGSQGFPERMNLLYSSGFKYPDNIELMKKSSDFMDSSTNNSSFLSLTRYRSAPTSFLERLNNGPGYDDFQYDRTSSPEIDNFVAKYMLGSNQGFGDSKCVKREEEEPVAVTQSGGYSFGGVSSMGLESSIQPEKMDRNGSGLARRCSSPAELFSRISTEIGSTLIRDVNGFRTSNGVNGDASPSSSPLYGRVSLAPPRSRPNLPRIVELENELIGLSGPEDGNMSYMSESRRHFIPNFDGVSSWPNSPVKRARESEGNSFPPLNRLPAQVDSRERCTTLTHHLSLPKSFTEMASGEKLMQFQGSIPCKIRAKRGCATHPRSIAERVRRTRISERMRKLQDLFPNLDKQTNTADMLEMAVEYIKDLQKEVKTLSDAKANCTCTSTSTTIHNQYSNLSA